MSRGTVVASVSHVGPWDRSPRHFPRGTMGPVATAVPRGTWDRSSSRSRPTSDRWIRLGSPTWERGTVVVSASHVGPWDQSPRHSHAEPRDRSLPPSHMGPLDRSSSRSPPTWDGRRFGRPRRRRITSWWHSHVGPWDRSSRPSHVGPWDRSPRHSHVGPWAGRRGRPTWDRATGRRGTPTWDRAPSHRRSGRPTAGPKTSTRSTWDRATAELRAATATGSTETAAGRAARTTRYADRARRRS